MPPSIRIDALLERYPALLLDAYGVLLHSSAALPGAIALIDRLEREARSYFILTNDASRLPETAAAYYHRLGLSIPPERVITAGSLLGQYFDQHGLRGAKTAVFGTGDSRLYLERAGGVLVAVDEDPEVIAICDEATGDFLADLDAVLSALLQAVDRGSPPRLVVANPDLVYPKAGGRFGVAAGSIAELLERAIALRWPSADPPRFDRLGKPFPAIFEEASRRAGTRDLVMIGDQLETDILGARRFGIDSALVITGVSRWSDDVPEDRLPSWLLSGLA